MARVAVHRGDEVRGPLVTPTNILEPARCFCSALCSIGEGCSPRCYCRVRLPAHPSRRCSPSTPGGARPPRGGAAFHRWCPAESGAAPGLSERADDPTAGRVQPNRVRGYPDRYPCRGNRERGTRPRTPARLIDHPTIGSAIQRCAGALARAPGGRFTR